MTVSELIEELRKHPGHHTVMLETYEPDLESGCPAEVWNYVGTVEGMSNVGDIGPIVRIVADV